jgi:hypothetical protein
VSRINSQRARADRDDQRRGRSEQGVGGERRAEAVDRRLRET